MTRRYRRSVHPPARPLDVQRLFAARLHWTTDAEFPWLRSEDEGQEVFLRLNTRFPDEPAYSLLVDADVTLDFDDLPQCWTRGPLDWPEATGK